MSNEERDKLNILKKYGYMDEHAGYAPEHLRLSQWAARQLKMEKEGIRSVDRKKRIGICFVFQRNKPYSKRKQYTEKQEKNVE